MTREVREPRDDEEWRASYELRWRVLRAPWDQPRGSERDEQEERSLHRVCVELAADGALLRVIGTARAHHLGEGRAQIRYMAVEESCRGEGVGADLLISLEEALRADGVVEVVLNARESALRFYERAGYRVVGEAETLYGEIPHARMAKSL